MTTALAIYAAVVATCGIGWQIYTWWHGRRLHVRVGVRIAQTYDATGHWKDWVVITAVSRTNYPVRTTNAGLKAESLPGKTLWCVNAHPLATIPGVIPPHDSAQAFLDAESMAKDGLDLGQPIRACVALSTDERVWSEPTVLRP
jgi:hypothetical protein